MEIFFLWFWKCGHFFFQIVDFRWMYTANDKNYACLLPGKYTYTILRSIISRRRTERWIGQLRASWFCFLSDQMSVQIFSAVFFRIASKRTSPSHKGFCQVGRRQTVDSCRVSPTGTRTASLEPMVSERYTLFIRRRRATNGRWRRLQTDWVPQEKKIASRRRPRKLP